MSLRAVPGLAVHEYHETRPDLNPRAYLRRVADGGARRTGPGDRAEHDCHDLHASLSTLEWTVNARSLSFAVLLMTGAALGDRRNSRAQRSVFGDRGRTARAAATPRLFDVARIGVRLSGNGWPVRRLSD